MASDVIPNIPNGSDVFLDTNVLIHGLQQTSKQCEDLLMKCVHEQIFGMTSYEVLNEMTHVLMIGEACAKGLIPSRRHFANAYKSNPYLIQQLSRYRAYVPRVLTMNILILNIREADFVDAQKIRDNSSLLSTDSLIVSVMNSYGLSFLASRDTDFDRAPTLTRFYPSDC